MERHRALAAGPSCSELYCDPSTRNEILAMTRYPTTLSFSTLASNSLIYIDLIPRNVLQASASPLVAASSQLVGESAISSITFTTDIGASIYRRYKISIRNGSGKQHYLRIDALVTRSKLEDRHDPAVWHDAYQAAVKSEIGATEKVVR
jgi:hypothetical protein